MVLLLLILFPSISCSCTKDIEVMVFTEKMLPSLLDFSKKVTNHGKEIVTISCKLYNEISVGDILYDPKNPTQLSVKGSLFSGPLEEIKYKVLRK